MLRKASSRRLVLATALAGALGLSIAHAQTISSQGAITADTPLSNKIEAGGVAFGRAATIGGAGMFHGLSVAGGSSSSELPAVVDAPLSAVLKREEVTKLLDGNRIVRTSSTRMLRDSQGRTRIEHVFPPGSSLSSSGPSMVQVTDPLTGENFTLNMQQRTATMLPPFMPSPALQAPVAAPPLFPQFGSPILGFSMGGMSSSRDLKETALGEKTIDGIRTVGKRADYTIPANTVGNQKPITIQLEQWFSPELGVVVLSTQRSRVGIESTYKLEQIERDEPDRALFTVPADFTKEDISERLQQFRRLRVEPTPATPPK